jgi:uncharacterized coiled-coil protein SlyX
MKTNRIALAVSCALALAGISLARPASGTAVSKVLDDGGKQPLDQRMTHVEERMQAAEARILSLQQTLGETVASLQALQKRHASLLAKHESHQHAIPLVLWTPTPGYPLDKITFVIAQGKSSRLVTKPMGGTHN